MKGGNLLDLFTFFISVTQQVGILFMLILLGILLKKKDIVTEGGIKELTTVLLYVVTPAVIMQSMMDVECTRETATQLLIAIICSIIFFTVAIIFVSVVCRNKDNNVRTLERSSIVFSNCGFMSLPIAGALFGSEGVFLVSIFVAMFNIMFWTYGIFLFQSDSKISAKKIFINPGFLSVCVGLVLFFFSINLPTIIAQPIYLLSAINSPLAMLVLGSYLASVTLKPQPRDLVMWRIVICRLLIVPLICMFIFRICGLSGTTLSAIMIPIAAPVATNIVLFSAKFDKEPVFAARIVAFSTLCSIFTLPIILTISQI